MYNNGPLANPPVPITQLGLNFLIIKKDLIKLKIILKGINKLERLKFLFIPDIHKPVIRYPFSGTFFISILFLAPTNSISIFLILLDNSSAIEIAGYICPPVPPPDIKNLCCFT